ncbi:MAG: T9SS type A sorting domain-containing protein [Candidatus Zixiibacteriota bacterium]|nr:MAG: T9SS type A sorting domain-containing protein [candidate division Zixibacteria bacterium]
MLIGYGLITLLLAIIVWGSDLYAQYDPIIIGSTYGSAQSGGSPGDRIAIDNNGGVHFTWMKYIAYPSFRLVYYNYVDSEGNWLTETAVSPVNGSGYPQLSIAHGDRAGIAYHSAYSPGIENYVIYAEDTFAGFGIYQYFDPPDLIRYRCYWPKLTIDRDEFIHIIATENPPNAGDPMILGHCYSTNGGFVWSKFVAIDTLTTVSAIVISSPVSRKVSIVYCHPIDFSRQIKNDIYFRQIKFDDSFIDYRSLPVNVTEYGQNDDSLFAFDQLDALYDYNDNLHIVWNAFWVTDTGINPTMFLYHYDFDSGIITGMNSITWPPDTTCRIPAGNYPICNMSMAINDSLESVLFVAYSMFDTSDCSAYGYANADVYLQYSLDGGSIWSDDVNITNTQTPGCTTGTCHSEVWPSLADRVGEYFAHLSYIDDRSGGAMEINKPIYYHKYNVWQTGLYEEQHKLPCVLSLLRAYPNPFNARTTIEFALADPGDVELTIYDITGASVGTVRRPGLQAGRHTIVWDAKDASSGVYFAHMNAGGSEQSIKMVLLK